jgi:hypothetical protein
MRINLHWGISNLLVLTIIVAMLGSTQFALAAAHKPSLCRTCCAMTVLHLASNHHPAISIAG